MPQTNKVIEILNSGFSNDELMCQKVAEEIVETAMEFSHIGMSYDTVEQILKSARIDGSPVAIEQITNLFCAQ